MAIVVNTNINALMAQNFLTNNEAGLSQALTRLASGKRINSASDDPAGAAIAATMQSTSAAYTQAARNGGDGISLLDTAQTSMQDITGILQQMNSYAAQAANGVYSSSNLGNIEEAFGKLLSEVDRVANSTNFNGINLLDGSTSSITLQIGAGSTSNDQLTVSLTNMTSGALSISSLSVATSSGAQAALSSIGSALTTVTTALAGLGASQTNLTKAVSLDNSLATSLAGSISRIQDADLAAESTNYGTYNVLAQSSIAMLAQANAQPQMALKLLG